jgi:glycerol kinase
MRIAAIDQGTTSTRILVVEDDGTARVAHAVRHRQIHPAPGHVEHDPEEIVAAIEACLAAAGPVDAIGLDNQGESCLAWDAVTREALSPIIVWQDNRTAEATERLKADGAETLTLERAGLPLDPYFSASKLAWILANVPAAAAARRAGRLRLGTTDAFFLDRLAGSAATDMATASRTSLMNLGTGAWDPELCALFGVPIEALPPIVEPVSNLGSIGGIPVTASIVDQQAALYGHGCRADGDLKITFGTGAFCLAVTGERIVRAPGRGLLPTLAWSIGGRRSYAVDGGVYDAGAAVEWAQRIGLVEDLAEIAAFDAAPAIERGLAFVPALSGLACPHWDRGAAATFIGMAGDTTRRDLQQALVEGIALATAEVVTAIDAEVPVGDTLSVDGGLTRSPYLLETLAAATGRRVRVAAFEEMTAFGTAALAAEGLGRTLASPVSPEGGRLVEPRPVDREAWRGRFAEAVSRAKRWR